MPHRLYLTVADRADHRCEYCGAPERVQATELEVEHIAPRAHGGEDTLGNLALACGSCNRRKAQAIDAIDPVTGRSALLFNPRIDVWYDHFEFDPESGQITGLSATGRAPVERFDLNRPFLLASRLSWFEIGWFPP
jgi:hypothetical protein